MFASVHRSLTRMLSFILRPWCPFYILCVFASAHCSITHLIVIPTASAFFIPVWTLVVWKFGVHDFSLKCLKVGQDCMDPCGMEIWSSWFLTQMSKVGQDCMDPRVMEIRSSWFLTQMSKVGQDCMDPRVMEIWSSWFLTQMSKVGQDCIDTPYTMWPYEWRFLARNTVCTLHT